MALRCGVNLKSTTSNHHPSRSMDQQQIREIEMIKREMDRDVISVQNVSRRRVAIGLVGFNSVILHVCPAHGRTLPLMGYSGSTGPDKWGTMSPSYGSCSFGNAQSPVQIMENDIVLDGNMGPFIVGYNDVNATLVNNGFNCELRYENDDAGGAIIDGKNYALKQMHWHSPSEHKIEGVRYAAELHMVHMSVDGSISVVAILYKYGSLDPLLSQIKEEFDELAKQASAGHTRARIPIKLVGIKNIVMASDSKEYFRYVGSLTTPPCTEKVIWSVFKEAREISVDQVAALKAPLDESCKNNSRPIQPMNGRHVGLSAAEASFS